MALYLGSCLRLLINSPGDVSVLSHLILESVLDVKNAHINCMYAKLYSYCSFGADCMFLIELMVEGLWVWGPERYPEFGGWKFSRAVNPHLKPRQALTWGFMIVCGNFEFFQLVVFIDLYVTMSKNVITLTASLLLVPHRSLSRSKSWVRVSVFLPRNGDKLRFLPSQQACWNVWKLIFFYFRRSLWPFKQSTACFNIWNLCMLPTQCIYAFSLILRIISDFVSKQSYPTGQYNIDGVCFLWSRIRIVELHLDERQALEG